MPAAFALKQRLEQLHALILQVLWVSHCGLTGLDGLNALPCLKELYAAFNQIENLEPIAGKYHTFDCVNR